MKTKFALLLIALSFCVAHPSSGADLFNARELSLSGFGSWVDKHDAKFAPGAGVSYFLTDKIGVGATTFWENYEGTFFDNVAFEGYFRWPLGDLRLAPYGLAGIGHSFETEETFGFFGGGAEFRFNEKWGVFGDLRWQVNGDTSDGVGLRIGARFVF